MSEKLEDQLNLALETGEATRRRTEDLNVGYDSSQRTWELIVKYSGTAAGLEIPGVRAEPLIAGYAILTVPESMVEQVAALPQIEYVEKPKRFYYSAIGPSERLCIAGIASREPFLDGTGILIAVLDSGITYARPEFRRADGSTRILALWDQSLEPREGLPGPPEGFYEGAEFDESRINLALAQSDANGRFEVVPSLDVSGHGTAVAGIASGQGTTLNDFGVYRGVAPAAELIVVKLGSGTSDSGGYSQTADIMRAVTYVLRKAGEFGRPLVINLSFGNTYGPHDGSSLLERFLDNAAEIGRTAICVGSGNEGNSAGHATGSAMTAQTVDLAMASFERSLSVQLWTYYADVFRVILRSPSGERRTIREPGEPMGGEEISLDGMRILAYRGQPTPYSVKQELYLEFLPGPNQSYLVAGVWQFVLEPIRVVTGHYDFYLSSTAVRNRGTAFLNPSPQVTLTIPSTASKVMTVGAFDSEFEAYADFSGRGYGGASNNLASGDDGTILTYTKPDFVAPGVNILAPDVYGGYIRVTGTSFATPILSGGAALLMEWGIVRGNDPFLYGEKLKAYLRAGAQPLRGESTYPNSRVGYGGACPAASL